MIRVLVTMMVVFGFVGCDEQNAEQGKQVETKSTIDSVEAKPKSIATSRDSVNAFLENPFDLHAFKAKQGMSNSGGGGDADYWFKPEKPGMYYRYFLFSKGFGYIGKSKRRKVKKENGLEITVYKQLGANQHTYIDTTELLIQVKASLNDTELPELAFVGLNSGDIKKKFGEPDANHNGCMIYKYAGKVLILSVRGGRVVWLKYVHVKAGVDLNQHPDLFTF